MKGILILFGSSIVSGIGWWLGSFVGIMTAIILSSIGAGVGIWATRWLMEEYLD